MNVTLADRGAFSHVDLTLPRPKAMVIGFWTVTTLLCLQIGFTAYAQLRLPPVAEAFAHLGFPDYFRVELAWAKFLGVLLLLAPVSTRLKEWAYAGFAITLGSALIAHFAVGDGPEAWGWAAATGVLWGISYFLWRRLQAMLSRPELGCGLRTLREAGEGVMREPTIFEHLGGADALRRLAEAQYRRCLTDPVLIRVFGTEGRPGHVEHLAAWLGEVFGGPDSYTRELGGHGALLRHHAGLSITEAERRRFVEIFLEAADEAELPSDERFRRRFREYIEWGSRIAMDMSQPGADITTRESVPRWGWE